MNTIGTALAWCAVQVTLVSLAAVVLYLLLRWLRPAAGALVVLTALGTILGLSALVLSPWPAWPVGRSVAVEEATTMPAAAMSGEASPASEPLSFRPPEEFVPPPVNEAKPAQPPSPAPPRRAFWDQWWPTLATAGNWLGGWPTMLAGVFLLGSAVGLSWLAVGVMAVRGFRRRSRAIEDARLRAMVESLCRELGSRRPIELRECGALATAATIGWRRPVILLSGDWTAWTEAQRRAVLAHEIAHVRSNDFLGVLCAQLGLALHFYHPLVHWLARRLRLEQELAADAAAASVSGGRQNYLMTIAELALRPPGRPLAWPARSFLPSRSMFLRRIAMLRDSRPLPRRLSPVARLVVVGVVVICGVAAAGLRRGGGAQGADAEANQGPSSAGNSLIDSPDRTVRSHADEKAISPAPQGRKETRTQEVQRPGSKEIDKRWSWLFRHTTWDGESFLPMSLEQRLHYSQAAAKIAAGDLESAEGTNRKVPGTIPQSEIRFMRLRRDESHFEAQYLEAVLKGDARAAGGAAVQYAKARAAVAEADLRSAEEANLRVPGTIPMVDIRQLRLKHDLAQLDVQAAEAVLQGDDEAPRESALRQAEARAKVAETDLESARETNRKFPGTIPTSVVRQLTLSRDLARLEVEAADAAVKGHEKAMKDAETRIGELKSEAEQNSPSAGPDRPQRDRKAPGQNDPSPQRSGNAEHSRSMPTSPEPSLQESDQPLSIRMRLSAVDDATGRPIPKARFLVESQGTGTWYDGNEQGECVVSLPARERPSCWVRVRAGNYVPMQATWFNGVGTSLRDELPEAFTFRMVRGTTVGGIVVDIEGRPVKGAAVLFSAEDRTTRPGSRAAQSFYEEKLATDDRGRWACDFAPQHLDAVGIRIEHPNYEHHARGWSAQSKIEELRDKTLKCILTPGYAIRGRVVDPTHKPLEEAVVALGDFSTPKDRPLTRTDAQGRFEFTRLAAGSDLVTVVKPGFAPAQATLPKAPPLRAPWDPVATTPADQTVDFQLHRGKPLRIHVVDSQGKPIQDAAIYLDRWRGHQTLEIPALFGISSGTDAQGTWEWADAPPDETLTIRIGQMGYMDVTKLDVSSRQPDVTVTLKRPQVIQGLVTDAATKQPVKDFVVQKGFLSAREPGGVSWSPETVYRGRDGHYRREITMPQKAYRWRILAEGYEPAVSEAVPVTEGERTINFQLTPKTPKPATTTAPEKTPHTTTAGPSSPKPDQPPSNPPRSRAINGSTGLPFPQARGLADPNATPAEQYQALVQEKRRAFEDFNRALKSATSEEDRRRITAELGVYTSVEVYQDKIAELIARYPDDPVAFDAFVWLAEYKPYGDVTEECVPKIGNELIRSDRAARVCERLYTFPGPASAAFLERVLGINRDPKVQGLGRYALAQYYKQQSERQDSQRPGDENAARAEALLEDVARQYGEIDFRGTTLKKAAEQDLLELHHLAIGRVAPEIECLDMEGRPLKLSGYRGKCVLLVFTGPSWCGPCRAEVPVYKSLAERLQGKRFTILMVCNEPDRQWLQKFVADEGLSWPISWDDPSKENAIATRWNIRAWPTLYLLDDRGIVRYKGETLGGVYLKEEKDGEWRQHSELDDAVDAILKEMA